MRSELHLEPTRFNPKIDEAEWTYRFSSKLDKLMRANGVGNKTLADAIGMSRSSVREYREGIRTPSAYTVVLICHALGCTTSALMDV